MGWCGGADVAREMVEAINQHVPDVKIKRKLYRALIEALESNDWDTQNEAMGIDPIFDKLIQPED